MIGITGGKISSMNHPNDDTGDALRRMEASGDVLSRPRNIDFNIVFPNQHSAEAFAKSFRHLGYTVSIQFAETVRELPWDVLVAKYMVPSHSEITEFENLLQDEATPLKGRNDGWGCFSEAPPAN